MISRLSLFLRRRNRRVSVSLRLQNGYQGFSRGLGRDSNVSFGTHLTSLSLSLDACLCACLHSLCTSQSLPVSLFISPCLLSVSLNFCFFVSVCVSSHFSLPLFMSLYPCLYLHVSPHISMSLCVSAAAGRAGRDATRGRDGGRAQGEALLPRLHGHDGDGRARHRAHPEGATRMRSANHEFRRVGCWGSDGVGESG